ncbi:MAG: BspA family leucine-rich repeat surface protein [Cytophagales bacterium]|nr:MAG: BspA family leucine-rich repeat surface protein [Cytophagales bacterium]
MRFCTTLFLSFFTFCSFLTSTSYAQEEKDYFITLWDLSKVKSTTIEFYALTTGDVNYTWETIPADESGSGKFNVLDKEAIIANLPSKQIKLKLSPQNLKRFYFEFSSKPNSKLIDVPQWGSVEWTSMERAFSRCFNLNITATDIPNLSKVSSMKAMFEDCIKLNGPTNINSWNTENVTNMSGMLSITKSFNQAIGNWNTQNVTDMSWMFARADSFNQAIGKWNTQNVKDMSRMFAYTSSFNQAIGNWNTEKVTDMGGMFSVAISFNQAIGNWNTEKVIYMVGMFYGADAFNQAIGNWNTQNVGSMENMFYGATSFNQAIGNWNTQNVKHMGSMFEGASSFNQDIGSWNTQNVTDMKGMLSNSGIDCKNYSNTLIGWANNTNTAKKIVLVAEGLKYSSLAKPARDFLSKPIEDGGKGWTISGDALSTEDCGLVAREEGEEQSSIALYPNPAKEVLYLKNAPMDSNYSIFDGLGRLVSSGQCQNEAISIATLASGLYSLRLGNKQYTFVKE